MNTAVEIFSRHKYFEAHHSRALFIKSMILRQLGEFQEAQGAFDESLKMMRQVIATGSKPAEMLTEEDFDELIPIWNK